MKKIILVAGFLLSGSYLLAAAYQPTQLGWVDVSIASATISEINATTPKTIGVQRFCTNCGASGAAGTVCTSTATTTFSFVLSTGTACK